MFQLILRNESEYDFKDGDRLVKWLRKKDQILKKVMVECKRSKMKMVGSEIYQPFPAYPESTKYIFK